MGRSDFSWQEWQEGSLFKDRFKSKIVDNDHYLKTVSLYIHNNPKDIGEFKPPFSP
jgi:hypothetical protein